MALGPLAAVNIGIKVFGIASLAAAAANQREIEYPKLSDEDFGDAKGRRDPSPLLGGLSLEQFQQGHAKFRSLGELARKNLFLLRVSSRNAEATFNNGVFLIDRDSNPGSFFYFYAIEVSYAPYTTSGEKRRIGALTMDSVQSGDPVEMRITTYDNQEGSIKNWFRRMSDAAVLTGEFSGLVGLPSEYVFDVEVTHAYVDDELVPEGKTAYTDKFVMRVGQIDIDLSRRDNGLQELQMTFVQTDQFMS